MSKTERESRVRQNTFVPYSSRKCIKRQMTKNTKWKDYKRQKQKVTSDKTDLHPTHHPPASFSSYQLYRRKKCDFDFLKKRKGKKQRRKKQNDNKDKITKNVQGREEEAPDKTNLHSSLITPLPHFRPIIFSFSDSLHIWNVKTIWFW